MNAFQLVAGQNPDTTIRVHRARATWSRQWSPATVSNLSAAFDRLGSLLVSEENAVGPAVFVSGLATLGPNPYVPIDRAENRFRYAGDLSPQPRQSRAFDGLRNQPASEQRG